MKRLLKKVATVVGSAVLVGATMGGALAATYPTPFTSNTAVVTGVAAAPDDLTVATSIVSDLKNRAGSSGGSSSTVIGNGSYKFETSYTKLHLGSALTSIKARLDSDELPTLLRSGTYEDYNDEDHDYTQKIDVASGLMPTFFKSDSNDALVLGLSISSDDPILNYTLDFSDEPDMSALEQSSLPIFNKEYYVLDVDSSSGKTDLVLLDSATDVDIKEGETKTVTVGNKTYTISGVDIYSDTEAEVRINGELKDNLRENVVKKLSDGSYLGIKNIRYSSKESKSGSLRLSIGSGKLELINGELVKLNEEEIEGLYAHITNTSTLSKVVLEWKADDDYEVTENSTLTMPGFQLISLAFKGLSYDSSQVDTIEVKDGGSEYLVFNNFPLKDSSPDIYLAYGNGTGYNGAGKSATHQVRLPNSNGNVLFDKDTDDYFIVSYHNDKEVESYLVKASSISSDNKTTLQWYTSSGWSTKASDQEAGDTVDIGSAEIMINAVDYGNKLVNISAANSYTEFDRIYSKNGMAVNLVDPTDLTSFSFNLTEEDANGNPLAGNNVTITAGWTTGNKVTVSNVEGVSSGFLEEEGSDGKYYGYVYSPLATKVYWDKTDSTGQYTTTLTYYGDEVGADVYLTSSSYTVGGSSSGDLGIITVKDNEASKFSGKNLVVVGGPCVNTVAAELLGVTYPYCGSKFESKTGIKAGEALIQAFSRKGNTALLVAGYNAADTKKAGTYLTTVGVGKVSTTPNTKKYKVTSTTEATSESVSS